MPRLFKLFFPVLPVCFLLISASAQTAQSDSVATKLDKLIPQRLPPVAPGGVVLIVKNDNVIYRKAFGLADVDSKSPMQPDMFFRIGSMSKQYTAVAILELLEQGKIKLQDSIQKYIPDFPYKGYPITIENLLTQTSGIKDYLSEIDNPAKEKAHFTPRDGVNYIEDAPLNFQPGTNFKYSNSNFYLLGYIIEKITGEPFEVYLKKNVLDKAGLENTFYIDSTRNVSNMCHGYSRIDGKLENADLQGIDILYAAGGLISNADDIFKWHRALYDGKLIKSETLRKATTAFRFADGTNSQYAYGWFIKNIDGSPTIEHSGSTDGYQTDAIYLPDENLFVVALFNCFEADMDWQVLTNDIARVALGKPVDAEFVVDSDLLKSYTGVYEVVIKKESHKLVMTFEDQRLYVEDTNPADHLPKLKMIAEAENKFTIKESPELKFYFEKDTSNGKMKIVTYNRRGKDAEWTKIQ